MPRVIAACPCELSNEKDINCHRFLRHNVFIEIPNILSELNVTHDSTTSLSK